MYSCTPRLHARLRVCAWACIMAGGLACAPMAAAHGGQAADLRPGQGLGWSHTPGSSTLASGAPRGAPGPCPSLFPVLPTPGTDWHPQGRVQAPQTPLPCWSWCVPCPCVPHTPPGAAQREEKSLTASAQSATLSNLQPNTEYVVMLRPRYAQQPAVPATLTARTREYSAQPRAQLGLGLDSQHRDAPLQSLCPTGMGLPGPLLPVGMGWGCR